MDEGDAADKMHGMKYKRVFSAVAWLVAVCMSVPVFAASDAVQGAVPAPTTASLETEVAAKPNDYQAWFKLGVVYSSEHHFHQAINAFRKVIALRPDLAEPHNNLAVIYNELGDDDSAVQELQIALKKQPGYTKAEENLADLYLKLAIEHYHNVLDQAPNPVLSARYERLLHVRDPLATPVNPSPDVLASPPAAHTDDSLASPALPKPPASSSTNGHVPKADIQAPSPSKPVAVPSDYTAVMHAFEAWRAAWGARDLDGYFAAYSDDFTPDAHTSHAAWMREKRRIIMAKNYIHVGAKNIVFKSTATGKRAQLSFLEDFVSNDYKESTRKLLEFAKINGVWKIVHEADM